MIFESEYNAVTASHRLEKSRPIQEAAVGSRYVSLVYVNYFIIKKNFFSHFDSQYASLNTHHIINSGNKSSCFYNGFLPFGFCI